MKEKQKKSRKKELSTKDKILQAATPIFAEHGYKEATVRMICQKAKVNGALVNYYFRSKKDLYREVICFLCNTCDIFPAKWPDVTDEASWKSAIRKWISTTLHIAATEKPPASYVARLLGRESCIPTEMFAEFNKILMEPQRKYLMKLIRMGLDNPQDVQADVIFSATYSQCVIYATIKPHWMDKYCPKGIAEEDWLELTTNYICKNLLRDLSYHGNRE